MAIDTAHHRLFSGCRSGVMAVSDYQAGQGRRHRADRRRAWTAPAFDAGSGDAFAANADGTLTVIHQDSPDKYSVVQTLQTAPGARNMGLDPETHRLFLVSSKYSGPPLAASGRGPAASRRLHPDGRRARLERPLTIAVAEIRARRCTC